MRQESWRCPAGERPVRVSRSGRPVASVAWSPATAGAKRTQRFGCCDDSPHKHATKHFHATQHPVIEGYDPPEGWGWCYVDEVLFDLSDRITPHNGPIPRYY